MKAIHATATVGILASIPLLMANAGYGQAMDAAIDGLWFDWIDGMDGMRIPRAYTFARYVLAATAALGVALFLRTGFVKGLVAAIALALSAFAAWAAGTGTATNAAQAMLDQFLIAGDPVERRLNPPRFDPDNIRTLDATSLIALGVAVLACVNSRWRSPRAARLVAMRLVRRRALGKRAIHRPRTSGNAGGGARGGLPRGDPG